MDVPSAEERCSFHQIPLKSFPALDASPFLARSGLVHLVTTSVGQLYFSFWLHPWIGPCCCSCCYCSDSVVCYRFLKMPETSRNRSNATRKQILLLLLNLSKLVCPRPCRGRRLCSRRYADIRRPHFSGELIASRIAAERLVIPS